MHLGAFKLNVFMGFHEMRDFDGQVKRLHDYLGGRGVPDVASELQELYLKPILDPFRTLADPSFLFQTVQEGVRLGDVTDPFLQALSGFLKEVRVYLYAWREESDLVEAIDPVHSLLKSLLNIHLLRAGTDRGLKALLDYLFSQVPAHVPKDLTWWRVPLLWGILCRIGTLVEPEAVPVKSRALMDDLLLGKVLRQSLVSLGLDEGAARFELLLVQTLVSYQDWYELCVEGGLGPVMENLFADADAQTFMGVNEFGGKLWFNKESFERLLYWLFTISAIRSMGVSSGKLRLDEDRLKKSWRYVIETAETAGKAGYAVTEFLSSF